MDAGLNIMLPKVKPTKPVLREERIREFASEMALHFTGAIFDNLEGAKSGEVEPLHDMRVASRRLRETLRLFQPYYAPLASGSCPARLAEPRGSWGCPEKWM